jgi:predicted RNA-binding protein with RPS1 domain
MGKLIDSVSSLKEKKLRLAEFQTLLNSSRRDLPELNNLAMLKFNQQEEQILEVLKNIRAYIDSCKKTAYEIIPAYFWRQWSEDQIVLDEFFRSVDGLLDSESTPSFLSRPWSDPAWSSLEDETESSQYIPLLSGLPPELVRIGDLYVGRGIDEMIPALVPIRRDFNSLNSENSPGHIVIYSQDSDGRKAAVDGLQSIALRTILTFPARTLQTVFIDPVSMGNTFPFKGLTNFITGQQVYTRTTDIRDELHKLTVHLEQVIQNYLSNRYPSIEAYNSEDSTIPESYRYVFISDFPANFDATSCEYLKSLLVNGPKAGIYVVLHVDDSISEKPRDFNYNLFDDLCTVLKPVHGMTAGGSFESSSTLKEGYVYLGKVNKVTDRGAYVEFLPGKEGFVDRSHLSESQVRYTSSAVSLGQVIHVKVLDFDNQSNKVRLTCQGISESEKRLTERKVQSLKSGSKALQMFTLKSPNEKIDFWVNLDTPPSIQQFEKLAELMNSAVDEAGKQGVSIPLPIPDQPWLGNSAQEIRAQIGKTGSDSIDFWMGNNNDGLVVSSGLLAGKPGAGKSVTLHAIITSLSMCYSPDELELYLLDFKEGVEFQIYIDPDKNTQTDSSGTLNSLKSLPHAKLVSIESDREFGLSVLSKVQNEIENRGKLFKDSGVSNVGEYRNKNPQYKLPRILLIIDEFQYMLQESDNITSQINKLFEDITRRGRAFGVHLLIASQSPNVPNMSRGIYSFIELRMAMQMDQNTASSVLADGNTDAVDLLDRPGKLIYNIDYGRKGHNVIGQVCKATAEDAKHTLKEIYRISVDKGYQRSEPLIVFNGNRATSLTQNSQLLDLTQMDDWLSASLLNRNVLREEDWLPQESPCLAWLGEAMRIGGHTRAIFRRRARSNMLLIGSSEEIVFGILAGILVSLTHTSRPNSLEFNILDTSQTTDTGDNYWSNMTLSFMSNFSPLFPILLGKRFPDPDQNILRSDAVLQTIYDKMKKRDQYRSENPDDLNIGPSVFFICALGSLNRAQNLRPVVGRRGDEMSPDAEKLLEILSKGPELGIHTILWLDRNRSFLQIFADSRSAFTHFDLRVGLKMPADDSRQFFGESYAQKLPRMRAYFQDVSLAMDPEKFKPYSIPIQEQFVEYANNLQSRL